MPNREIKEERRKIGPADPATRNRLINEAIAGGGGKPAPKAPPVRGSSSTPSTGGATPKEVQSGISAVRNRKRDIESAIEEAGG